jgi:hypothetical protein
MQRRQLLKLSALSVAGASLPWLRTGHAQTTSYAGPYWIFLTAGGGWDPRFLYDPTLEVKQNRIYKEIGKVGNISFAPIDATPDEFGLAMDAPVNYLNPERFLNKFGERLLVCNGVDTGRLPAALSKKGRRRSEPC